MLLRTDPGTHRLSYLSIPRDLRVEIPGYGSGKINAANQFGGPALTLATVRNLTGLPINHVIVVDFDGFKDLIDALGGIDITVPKPILSNKFDCPYPPARCSSWEGWRFGKGPQHMDGRRALVYSRIRTNQLDPSESDVTRTARQQAVADAVGDKIASFGTFVKLPFMGDSLASPLATDLSAWQLAQLGWVRFRAGKSLRCRLGGEPQTIGGESVIVGGEDNVERDPDVHGPHGAACAAEGRPVRGRLYAAALAGVRGRLLRLAAALVSAALVRLVGRGLVTAAVTVLRGLAAAAAVVRRVEPGALEVHGDGEEQLLDRPGPADGACLHGRVAHLLEDLERVPVGATVFVDRHRRRLAWRPEGVPSRLVLLAVEELAVAGRALEGGEPPWAAASALDPAPTIERRDRRRRAEQSPEEERPRPLASLLAVHARILRSTSCSSVRSAT